MLRLISTTNTAGGNFQVKATTTKKPVELTISHAPFNSVLYLDASTTEHAFALIELCPNRTFTGTPITTFIKPNFKIMHDQSLKWVTEESRLKISF